MRIEDKLSIRYACKNLALEIKDIDDKEGIVSGYYASFDSIDADNDVIRKGAFKKSIQERGPLSAGNRRIAHLRNHDWDRQIGKILELDEDQYGLRFVSKMGRSTEGKDALLDYQDGILREHSIGFNYIADKVKYVEDSEFSEKGHYDITEVKLWEGSGVTFGSNSLTPVIDAAKSSGDYNDLISKIHILEESFMKAIKNGKGTDARLENIEMRFKQIQQLRDSLIMEKPSFKDTFVTEKPNEAQQKAELYDDYPKQAIANAKKGIELNEAVGNKCATDVGKQRGRDIAAGRGFSLDVLNRVYSYLSRAEEYYDASDEKACGTISYLLWGGKSMKAWSGSKLSEIQSEEKKQLFLNLILNS